MTNKGGELYKIPIRY